MVKRKKGIIKARPSIPRYLPEEKAFLERRKKEREARPYSDVDYLKRKALLQGRVLLSEERAKRAKLQKLQVGQQFSREQELMNEMFAGESTLGAGHNLPKFNGVLITGYGLINNEDYGDTGSMFGINRRTE